MMIENLNMNNPLSMRSNRILHTEGNFELLRIIAIILITLSHLASSIGWPESFYNPNKYIVIILSCWGQVGVNLFFLISVYFLRNQKFRFSKLLRIIIISMTYICIFNVLQAILMYKTGQGSFFYNIISLFWEEIKQPIFSREYWFVTSYIMMYISFPFANLIKSKLTESEYKKMLIVLTACIPCFSNFSYSSVVMWYAYTMYIYFLQLYLCEHEHVLGNKKVWLFFITITIVVSIAFFSKLKFCGDFMETVLGNRNKGSAIMLIEAIYIFYIIKNISIKSMIYSKLSELTLGIYLFHENMHFSVKDKIAFEIMKYLGCNDLTQYRWCFLVYIFETIILLILGGCVEKIRSKLMNPIERIVVSKEYGIDKWMNI